jgi:2-keto-4-pentenoate hydratase/2-oxohepta-3-ene-1,7-dioic acid hydratase in catechol pathway
LRLCFFNDFRLGGVRGDRVVDFSAILPPELRWRPQEALVHVMACWDEVRPLCESLLEEERGFPLERVRLRPPVPQPSKIVAAPVNYLAHQQEVDWAPKPAGTIEEMGFFLKAPSSVVGPGEAIVLPFLDRRVDFEGELGVVIGRRATRVPAAEALTYVFGYCCLFDISLREPFTIDRSARKSFDTFTPLGPWIATADEVPDPQALRLRTWRNDRLCQDASTGEMIVGCAEQVARASAYMTLLPGDVLATGTPAGVGPIRPGDRLVLEVERVGRLAMQVRGPAD